jgi:signal peptidase I
MTRTSNDMKKITLKVQLCLKSLRNGVLTIVIPILIAIVLRVFFIEIYKIPSSSMEPALVPGDFILVSKMSYGARLLRPVKFYKQNRIVYVRTKGWRSIKKGDIFVFNLPQYNKYSDSTANIYGVCLVKRCYAIPGDTVLINNERIKNERIKNERIKNERIKNERIKNERINHERRALILHRSNLFPHDSVLDWSLDKYGPLYVPAKGQTIELKNRNVIWYRNILRYENPACQIKDSSIISNGKPVLRYTFQHNYYFMVGDNFYNSNDSRYWGFVPENNIIGKAVFVLFSIDPYEHGLKKFRWRRTMKFI